ncbi:PTS sugar transporter subunit IIA [Sanguibacter sp. A247]|uniref:PTS sugar transporter subunit IIA n=1 Tax=unclassified Sanguibacter TaxID=2645534 RepID=UPI003FD861F1
MSAQIITADLVSLGLSPASTDALIERLSAQLAAQGRVTDGETFAADVRAREAQIPTGMEGRVALPHAKSDAVLVPSIAVATVPGGLDFSGPDGDATLVFLVATPTGGADVHLGLLQALARQLLDAHWADTLRALSDPAIVARFVADAVAD